MGRPRPLPSPRPRCRGYTLNCEEPDYDITPIDADSPLFIGGDPNRSLFTGAIGAVAIYPTALAPQRIAAHAAAALGTDAVDHGKSKDTGTGAAQQEGKAAGNTDGHDEPAPAERPVSIPVQPAPTTAGKTAATS